MWDYWNSIKYGKCDIVPLVNKSSFFFNCWEEILGGQKVCLGFSIPSSGQTRTNFLANPVLTGF